MTDDERRLLALLAASDDGCTEAILLAHCIALELIDGIVSAGLATPTAERRFAAGRRVKATRVRITDAGGGWRWPGGEQVAGKGFIIGGARKPGREPAHARRYPT